MNDYVDQGTEAIDLGRRVGSGLRIGLIEKPHIPLVDQPGRPTVEAMREELISRAIGWIITELRISGRDIIAHLTTGRPVPQGEQDERRLLTLANAIRARERATSRLSKAEHARRCSMARAYLKSNPTAPGADVAMEFGIGRSIVSRIVTELWPNGRLVIHEDGRACHRGGRACRRRPVAS